MYLNYHHNESFNVFMILNNSIIEKKIFAFNDLRLDIVL